MGGLQPDILHVHEWQLSAVPMLYWDHYHKKGLTRPCVMLTIHNMDSSGECRQDEFAYSGRYSPGCAPHALPLQQQQHRAGASGTHPVLPAQSMLRWVSAPCGTGKACGRTPLLVAVLPHSLAYLSSWQLAEGGWATDGPPACAAAVELIAECKPAWGQTVHPCLTLPCAPLWRQGSQERCLPRKTKRWTSGPSATTLSACPS